MSQQWHFRGYYRRIGDDADVQVQQPSQQPSQEDFGCDWPPDVVEATTKDVANMQFVAASWLAMDEVVIDESLAPAVEQFVVNATMAISGCDASLCTEARVLSEEWQPLRKLVQALEGEEVEKVDEDLEKVVKVEKDADDLEKVGRASSEAEEDPVEAAEAGAAEAAIIVGGEATDAKAEATKHANKRRRQEMLLTQLQFGFVGQYRHQVHGACLWRV